MKAIYVDSSVAEKEAKRCYDFPEFVMMENAAMALEDGIEGYAQSIGKTDLSDVSVLILCGTGNNGGDGYALARRINEKVKKLSVVSFGDSKTEEAMQQRRMAERTGIFVLSPVVEKSIMLSDVIVDCVYGTGFHGVLPPEVCAFFDWCNKIDSYRIACDIPSGINKSGNLVSRSENGQLFAFSAHKTITMGALKTSLFSDSAKNFCGEIVCAELGIAKALFEKCAKPDAFLLEEKDIKLPERKNSAAHKGNFGHVAVVLGEKPGAGIIAGTAALKFGAGLVTVMQSLVQNQQFMMSPELMISETFPENTTAVLLGSGLGRFAGEKQKERLLEDAVQDSLFCVESMKNPAVVLDADFFYYENLNSVLERLNKLKNARVILTPHPKELQQLIKATIPEAKVIIEKNESLIIANRYEYGSIFAKKFPNLTLIAKGANTYIYSKENIFVCDSGSNALAKAGSGDVLAGMCTSLLAQGYSALDAAITAVFYHGKAGSSFENNWECTPFSLINKL